MSVVMSVYNDCPYLGEAVQSILEQTFDNFEFVIINDGSTDGSKEVLEQFEEQDDRIRLFHQKNRGLTPSLNRGLHEARGAYIARMDGDDISRPKRLEKQVRFLDSNSEVGIVGTRVDQMDADGESNGEWHLPTKPDLIAWELLFHNCLCHPSVMIRHSLLEELGGYANWAAQAQDYELWTRAVLESRLANLPEKLHRLRRHGNSITDTKRAEQLQVCCEATARLHEALLGVEANEKFAYFLAWMHHENVQIAIEETGLRKLPGVHEYVRTLYRVYVRAVLPKHRNMEVRHNALYKLDTLANDIQRHEGRFAGSLHRLRARFMHPRSEFALWLIQAVKIKLSKINVFSV
ncbi:glycosyltransferase [Salinibacter grassmerensis]|uniref:glycosyltransferase n=1 Tax=Salinibacter grassmerensis TaxID=3040353 RepID=UPI0021E7C9D1|nr:glycosyltransferase [Salinibacter grassmerensis]